MGSGGLLDGKRALVTGGSRGLGRAFCERFSADGADVAFNYSSDDEGARRALALIEANGSQGLSFKVSVLDAAGLTGMVRRIERSWGGIDILLNSAGVSQPLPVALLGEEDWDHVMGVNIKGQFLVARAVLPGMIRRRGGHILNISSLAGVRLLEAPIHYAASKGAVKGFSEALCKEVARYGVRVNCLAPGLLEEGLAQNLPKHRHEQFLKHVALHRRGGLDEVARFAAFMVSDRNTYMNGATIMMDGGL